MVKFIYMEYEPILDKLDELESEQAALDFEFDERLKAVEKYISAIAMNEVSYELASQQPLEPSVSLSEISDDIEELRTALPSHIEDAIFTKKQSLQKKHEQNISREQLLKNNYFNG